MITTVYNPMDHGFKDLAESDPRAMMHLTGRLPITAKATVTKVGPEVRAPAKLADHLSVVETPEETWLDQTEAVGWWTTEQRDAVRERITAATLVPGFKGLKIKLTIVLFSEEGQTLRPRIRLYHRQQDVVIILIPTWLRLYQTPASEALALDCPSAWALVPLMLHSEEELDEAGLRLAKTRNENAIVQFLLFAARKYDRNELRRRYGMFEQATVEIAKTTEFGQEIMQAGRREGLEEGMEKGRQVMLDAIRAVLRRKFPTLAEHPAIQMVSLDRANSVLDQIFQADTESAALAAITGGN